MGRNPSWKSIFYRVFASIDAGLGVHLEVARELGRGTTVICTRSAGIARAGICPSGSLLRDHDLRACVFGGFDDEKLRRYPVCEADRRTRAAGDRQPQRLRNCEITGLSRELDVVQLEREFIAA